MKREADTDLDTYAGPYEKVPAKFSEVSSVWADGQCIGCLDQWAAVRRENSNMQEFFLQRSTDP